MAAGGNLGAANAALAGGQLGSGFSALGAGDFGAALGNFGGAGQSAAHALSGPLDTLGVVSQFQAPPPPPSAPFPMAQPQPSMIGQATQRPDRPQPSYYLTPLGRVGVRPILPTV